MKFKPVTTMPPTASLDVEARVADRKRQLIDEIIEHKKSSRLGATNEIARIHARLSNLARIVKHDVRDGWAHMSPGAIRTVEEWIAR